jgi:dipeptidyl aminopeptidase/acylaminoacyl peptidase
MRITVAGMVFSAIAAMGSSDAWAERSGTPATTTPRAFAPMDVFELQWASDPAVAVDGRYAIYVRNGFDRMRDRRTSELWQIDLSSGEQQALGVGRQPVLSPDGKRLAFIADSDGKPQLKLRWLASNRETKLSDGARTPGSACFLNNETIAFLRAVPQPAAADLSVLPKPPKGAEWAPAVKVIDPLRWRADGAGELEPGTVQVFLVASDGGSAVQLTRAERDLGDLHCGADGALYVSAALDADPDIDPLESEIYRVDGTTGATHRLTTRKGPDTQPQLSPDRKTLIHVGFDDRDQFYQVSALYALDLASGSTRVLTPKLDRDVNQPRFRSNSSVVFQYDDRGIGRIGEVSLAGQTVREIASDVGGTAMGRPYGGGSFALAGDTLVYTSGADRGPAELALVRDGKSRPLTALNRLKLNTIDIPPIERVTAKSSVDGLEIEGWIVRPPGFDPAQRYPLLLEIHGGPVANYGPRFAPEILLYAAQGYIVVYANPRGSDSYGETFGNLIHHDYPNHDHADLLSVVDTVIAQGSVDERNLFVTGGSGGGVLTTWIVAHSPRFRAAVVAKPVINWTSFVLTADIGRFVSRYWFGGLPWEKPELYAKRSPLSYVGQIETPTMLITGEADLRTPIGESEQLFHALKLRGVPTRMVRIPGASHSINARPSNLIAQVLLSHQWFERYRVRDAAP